MYPKRVIEEVHPQRPIHRLLPSLVLAFVFLSALAPDMVMAEPAGPIFVGLGSIIITGRTM